ncbi:hypothetical protein PFISCL1PPCAC_8324, partial [Pristionchus fissidentatus]
ISQISLFFLYGCEYSHVIISFNRLACIAFPLHAPQLFERKATLILISIITAVSFIEISPYFWPRNCYFTYDFNTSLWNFADTDCGHFCSL